MVVEAPRGGERGILFFASFVIAVLLTVDVLSEARTCYYYPPLHYRCIQLSGVVVVDE